MKQTAKETETAHELTIDGEQKAWESGELGRDPKHARKLSLDEVQDYFGEKKGTSVRLPPPLIEQLRQLAARKGLGYQAYMRMILIEHVRKEGFSTRI
jgi:predicted DNA binding CopG/RHH family protein